MGNNSDSGNGRNNHRKHDTEVISTKKLKKHELKNIHSFESRLSKRIKRK